MKYVASMKSEHCNTVEGLDKLLRSLEVYLRDHPVMKEETFVSMLELAQKLNNEKLVEQCRVAKARCQETHKLLCLRQTTLRQAKETMISDEQKLDLSSSSVGSPLRRMKNVNSFESPQNLTPLRSGDNSHIWNPRLSSTPSGLDNSSPSPSTPPVTPVINSLTPVTSINSSTPVLKQTGTLPQSNDSLVTTDISDHVVTTLPKVSALLSSKEDLSGMCSSNVSLVSNNSIKSPGFIPDQGPGSAYSSNNRPVRKVLRRTTTAPPFTVGAILEEEDPNMEQPHSNSSRHDSRTISMITSSTDSLSR